MHMAEGAEPACYAYAGEVFRRQEDDPDRANEYFQAGFEVFDREKPAAADARVFALVSPGAGAVEIARGHRAYRDPDGCRRRAAHD